MPKWNDGDQFTVASLKYLDALLDIINPVPEENDLIKRFEKMGIGKNKTFNINEFDEVIQSAINKK
jgi:hypothetical protein